MNGLKSFSLYASSWNKKRDKEIPDSRSLYPDAERIKEEVFKSYSVDRAELYSLTRRGISNESRNVAIYLLRTLRGDNLDGDNRLKVIPSDMVVLAAGFVPKSKLEKLIEGIEAEVYMVGDCRKPGKIFDAIDFAAAVALRI